MKFPLGIKPSCHVFFSTLACSSLATYPWCNSIETLLMFKRHHFLVLPFKFSRTFPLLAQTHMCIRPQSQVRRSVCSVFRWLSLYVGQPTALSAGHSATIEYFFCRSYFSDRVPQSDGLFDYSIADRHSSRPYMLLVFSFFFAFQISYSRNGQILEH